MVDGVIVMPISTDGKVFDLLPQDLPAVAIDRFTLSDRVSHVLINNREISARATRMLTDHGHRRIALISGSEGMFTADERRKGYEEALQIAGCYDASLICQGDFTVDGGYVAMKRILQAENGVTAGFVTNYEMTVGAIIAINELGCKIPEDYSFIGFDNHELSKVITPKIATVNQPLREIGREAATCFGTAGWKGKTKYYFECRFGSRQLGSKSGNKERRGIFYAKTETFRNKQRIGRVMC